ncbi:TrbM/KikA/MpfK family conjugal transfer protein [Xenorhabdus cabanillasii]|uniref:TrbM/KikA/MpfK family conjugal transfer protein n=1 Tax=Xenorhabdus cabanillasii TaxID=351673 RepID=UPI000570C935|nr:TrbM/KikA/MpfK family conjugal transfer protein [Xenorhabdus cabanillasii]PHM75513.1 trbM family protein [Xenorhabdus cabanillasii JM26]
MKRKTTYAVCLLLCSLYTTTALADDPCKVTLCLWGKMNGSSSNECSKPERDFFNIVKKKRGSFLPNHTFDARKDFLKKECPNFYDVSQYVEKVLKKYGRVKL